MTAVEGTNCLTDRTSNAGTIRLQYGTNGTETVGGKSILTIRVQMSRPSSCYNSLIEMSLSWWQKSDIKRDYSMQLAYSVNVATRQQYPAEAVSSKVCKHMVLLTF